MGLPTQLCQASVVLALSVCLTTAAEGQLIGSGGSSSGSGMSSVLPPREEPDFTYLWPILLLADFLMLPYQCMHAWVDPNF